MKVDKRKGFRAAYHKLGPYKKNMFIIGILGVIIAAIFGTISLLKQLSADKVLRNLSVIIDEEYNEGKSVRKSIAQRNEELEKAIRLLNDAIEKVQQGEDHYFIIISGQLRALVATGSRSLNPLLLNLADDKGISLKCWGLSVTEQYINFKESMVFSLFPTRIVGHKPYNVPNVKKYNFKEWLNEIVLVFGDDTYTPNEIIRLYAEKEGGAHYDYTLPLKLLRAKEIIYSDKATGNRKYNEVEKLLENTAVTVVYLGRQVLGVDPVTE